MTAIWKPVPSYPGILASSDGHILLPPSFVPLPNGGYRTLIPKPRKGEVVRSRKDASHAYMGTATRRFGNLKVHQLVCEAFHGPKPFHGAVVIHLDENALNNRSENLKWGTQKENLNGEKFKEYCRERIGENSARAIWKARKDAA